MYLVENEGIKGQFWTYIISFVVCTFELVRVTLKLKGTRFPLKCIL